MNVGTENGNEFAVALRSAQKARNVALVVLAAALVSQIVVFSMVRWGGWLDDACKPEPMAGLIAATEPASQPAQVEAEGLDARQRRELLNWVLAAGKFFGFASSAFLCVVLAFALSFVMLGRLGGTASMAGAFFWSVVLLAALTPWQQIYAGSFACGATFNLGELESHLRAVKPEWGGAETSLLRHLHVYVRFFMYPLAAVMLSVVVCAKTLIGSKRSEKNLPVHETSSSEQSQ